jgi:hypothetical protein
MVRKEKMTGIPGAASAKVPVLQATLKERLLQKEVIYIGCLTPEKDYRHAFEKPT